MSNIFGQILEWDDSAASCLSNESSPYIEAWEWIKEWASELDRKGSRVDALRFLKQITGILSRHEEEIREEEIIAAFVFWRLMSRKSFSQKDQLAIIEYMSKQNPRIRILFGHAMHLMTALFVNNDYHLSFSYHDDNLKNSLHMLSYFTSRNIVYEQEYNELAAYVTRAIKNEEYIPLTQNLFPNILRLLIAPMEEGDNSFLPTTSVPPSADISYLYKLIRQSLFYDIAHMQYSFRRSEIAELVTHEQENIAVIKRIVERTQYSSIYNDDDDTEKQRWLVSRINVRANQMLMQEDIGKYKFYWDEDIKKANPYTAYIASPWRVIPTMFSMFPKRISEWNDTPEIEKTRAIFLWLYNLYNVKKQLFVLHDVHLKKNVISKGNHNLLRIFVDSVLFDCLSSPDNIQLLSELVSTRGKRVGYLKDTINGALHGVNIKTLCNIARKYPELQCACISLMVIKWSFGDDKKSKTFFELFKQASDFAFSEEASQEMEYVFREEATSLSFDELEKVAQGKSFLSQAAIMFPATSPPDGIEENSIEHLTKYANWLSDKLAQALESYNQKLEKISNDGYRKEAAILVKLLNAFLAKAILTITDWIVDDDYPSNIPLPFLLLFFQSDTWQKIIVDKEISVSLSDSEIEEIGRRLYEGVEAMGVQLPGKEFPGIWGNLYLECAFGKKILPDVVRNAFGWNDNCYDAFPFIGISPKK